MAMENYTSIEERIESGEFKPILPYPESRLYPTKEEMKVAKQCYRLSVKEGENRFKEACRIELGIDENHPKWNRCFEIAWELGHTYGFHEVWAHLKEISTLITD